MLVSLVRMTELAVVVLGLSALCVVPAAGGWVQSTPGTVLAATADIVLVTDAPIPSSTSESVTAEQWVSAYKTSTQAWLWTHKLCNGSFAFTDYSLHIQVASTFRLIEPGVLRYVCGPWAGSATSSHTVDAATGVMLANTTFGTALSFGYEGATVDPLNGLYCMKTWPPQCVYPGGKTVTLPLYYGNAQNQYFWGNTLVIAYTESIYFFDASTGACLGGISEYFDDTTSTFPSGTVAFVEDLVVLTYVSQTTTPAYAYVAVVNITQRAVTAQVRLANATIERFYVSPDGLPSTPTVVRRGAGLLVALPVYELPRSGSFSGSSSSPLQNLSLQTWEVPTTNDATTAASGANVPFVSLKAQIVLSTSMNIDRESWISMYCTPLGAFVACTGAGDPYGTSFDEEDSATALVSIETLSVVSKPTHALAIHNAGQAGDMLVVSDYHFYDSPKAAAFNATTGAVLWEKPFASIGPTMAYDAINKCVVLADAAQIVCVDASGSTL